MSGRLPILPPVVVKTYPTYCQHHVDLTKDALHLLLVCVVGLDILGTIKDGLDVLVHLDGELPGRCQHHTVGSILQHF